MRQRLTTVVRLVLLATLTAGLWSGASYAWAWWDQGRFEEGTDNAYVRGEVTPIAPKVAGYVVAVPVDDNQVIHAGDVLFRIDDADYRARVAQARAVVAMRRAAIANLESQRDLQNALIAQAEAEVVAAIAEQQRAELDRDRYAALAKTSAASTQKFEAARATAARADASVDAVRARSKAEHGKLAVLEAQRNEALAALDQAEAVLALAEIDLADTVVRAPISGIVANRQVRVGRYVTPGAPLLSVVPLEDVWIVANFKETQLSHMAVGQPVRVMVDGFPGIEIAGTIDSLAPGSGATFSLLPPDNATGNFIRIVQRVPVKIRLSADNPLAGRLVPGLSVEVAVDVSGGAARQIGAAEGLRGVLAGTYRVEARP